MVNARAIGRSRSDYLHENLPGWDPTFRDDLHPLIPSWPDSYSPEVAPELIIDRLLSRL